MPIRNNENAIVTRPVTYYGTPGPPLFDRLHGHSPGIPCGCSLTEHRDDPPLARMVCSRPAQVPANPINTGMHVQVCIILCLSTFALTQRWLKRSNLLCWTTYNEGKWGKDILGAKIFPYILYVMIFYVLHLFYMNMRAFLDQQRENTCTAV